MKDHQIKRESSDTFGRNMKADIALLRRVVDQDDYRSQQMLAMAVASSVLLVLCLVTAIILCTIFG